MKRLLLPLLHIKHMLLPLLHNKAMLLPFLQITRTWTGSGPDAPFRRSTLIIFIIISIFSSLHIKR